MLRFVSQVNNFFSFRESFSRRPSVVFLKARGAFMLRFAFEVNNFFPFRETFVSPWSQSFSSIARSVYAPRCFRSQQLFPFSETFVSPWSQSFFFNREERLCSPSLQESTVFFRFREISFRLRFREPVSLVARSVYAPPRSTSQPLFPLSSN